MVRIPRVGASMQVGDLVSIRNSRSIVRIGIIVDTDGANSLLEVQWFTGNHSRPQWYNSKYLEAVCK